MPGSPELIAAALAIAAVAGLVRGVTGFGGAMVMAPPFALLLGPLIAVPVVLLLESIVAAPQLAQTRAQASWRTVGPILAATCITLPLGAWVLAAAEPLWLRRATAAIVIVFSLLMLKGWRFAGPPRAGTGAALGGVAGAMLGATGIGGPPIILYLMAGPDRIEVTRANLTLFVAASCLAALALLWLRGVLDLGIAMAGLALAPAYLGGLFAGSRLFPRFSDRRFRQLALGLMIAVSVAVLLAA